MSVGGEGPLSDLRVLDMSTVLAGPNCGRYLADFGATVIKVESRTRPEFLRTMWASTSPHGLEGSPLFDALNAGKRSVTLNLKNSEGVAVARRLMHWADAVLENFAPRAMRGFGLDYETMVAEKPDLVMVSTCLNGQTGPHRNYPGFGGQAFDSVSLPKLEQLARWREEDGLDLVLEIDGGIAPETAPSARDAGADILVAGSAVFRSSDYRGVIGALRGASGSGA